MSILYQNDKSIIEIGKEPFLCLSNYSFFIWRIDSLCMLLCPFIITARSKISKSTNWKNNEHPEQVRTFEYECNVFV